MPLGSCFSEWRGSEPATVCNGWSILLICLSPLFWFVRAATICHQIYIMSTIYIISVVHFCSPLAFLHLTAIGPEFLIMHLHGRSKVHKQRFHQQKALPWHVLVRDV
jgi:hypothetical protein